MKTIWFGWLIIGKLLIPPKCGTSNHIFVSFVSKEIKFLSWHRACAVPLAMFGTLCCFAAVSCPTLTLYLGPLELPSSDCLGYEVGLQFSRLQWLSCSPRQVSQLLTLTPNHTHSNQHEGFAALGKPRDHPAPEDLQYLSRRSSQTWISLLHLHAIIQF